MALLVIYAFCSLLLASVAHSAPDPVSASNATANLAPAATSPLTFAASKWIWTASSTAGATVSLRKGFTPPLGKSLIAAEIIVTADSHLTFYVNGEYVGSGTPPNRGRFAQRFCVDLLPSFNVFAATGITPAPATDGGLLATILLTYSDFTTSTIVTDSSWRAHAGTPLGFEQLSFDDTAWPVAAVAGSFGDAPWLEVNIPADPPVITFDRAQWIWTDVVPASGTLPAGQRAFRRTFTPAPGQVPMSANIIIAVDNLYTLYVNGVEVGASNGFKVAHHHVVNFAPTTSEIVLAVLATNSAASTAGVLLAMEVNMVPSGRANCTAGAFLLSDAGWVSTKGAIPTGFEQPGFDDSAWPAVVAEANYPAAPWGTNTIAAPSAPVNV
ncbi:hypothetical protein B0H14DRAFT_3859123 [Mycena olivaceomarginata]|nr:hypothetical protein B0H14DRAFT_3878328 [Mycena olivaceomarginata]KAJ7876706.1 hypothetical protein B0H14DRAFT_3859123 [Mycena olivaceomarginata]